MNVKRKVKWTKEFALKYRTEYNRKVREYRKNGNPEFVAYIKLLIEEDKKQS